MYSVCACVTEKLEEMRGREKEAGGENIGKWSKIEIEHFGKHCTARKHHKTLSCKSFWSTFVYSQRQWWFVPQETERYANNGIIIRQYQENGCASFAFSSQCATVCSSPQLGSVWGKDTLETHQPERNPSPASMGLGANWTWFSVAVSLLLWVLVCLSHLSDPASQCISETDFKKNR